MRPQRAKGLGLVLAGGFALGLLLLLEAILTYGCLAEKAGIGAVVGGVLGGLLGGKGGAIAGILVGGGGAVVATKGNDIELPAGTVLPVRLERPLVMGP